MYVGLPPTLTVYDVQYTQSFDNPNYMYLHEQGGLELLVQLWEAYYT